ncbi:hypothetical protein [Bradyrhizobium sp. McL0616]|uniref:hypothetical protein n=1 Tax=Bradyrhizobium sp. McL0616 TaxID=3415674 RepID=UPI003CFB88E4
MFRAAAVFLAFLTIGAAVSETIAFAQSDPLPSWNDGATKAAITSLVARVTKDSGADFVQPAARTK